jgi:hypothetical protein
MKLSKFWLSLSVLLFGCSLTPNPSATQKSPSQLYREAFDRHFASMNRWQNAEYESSKCFSVAVAKKDVDTIQPCLDALPPPETYLPKDRRKDETIFDYTARKTDEWEERDCSFKGIIQGRNLADGQRIQDQCLQTLEIKRLRRELENQRK